MLSRLRMPVAAFAVLTVALATAPATNAAPVPPSSTLAAPVDVTVARAADSALSFQTLPNARCILTAPGTRARMTVYADDRGLVALHFRPVRGGAADGTLTTECAARGVTATKLVRVHVSAGIRPQAAVGPAPGAAPLVPRGLDPAALSAADITRLQLPPRPDAARDPKGFAQWRRAVTTPVTRIGGTTILRTDVVHGPAKLAGRIRSLAQGSKNGAASSNNWSGIVDTGAAGQFTYWVAGQWVVPSVWTDWADMVAYSSVWDGIDGWGSGDVIQNGTEQDAFAFPFFGSFASYSAWYEFYPDNGSTTLPNFSVNAGDEIYAVSWLCYDGNGQRYGCYYMENLTRGEATPIYSELGSQPGLFQGNSAEWVTERPTIGGNLYSLPAFPSFPFWWEHVYDSFAGGGYNACNEPNDAVTMYNGADALATASLTDCDTATFSWLNFH